MEVWQEQAADPQMLTPAIPGKMFVLLSSGLTDPTSYWPFLLGCPTDISSQNWAPIPSLYILAFPLDFLPSSGTI